MKWLLLHQFSALDLFFIAIAIKVGNSYGGAWGAVLIVVAMIISHQAEKRFGESKS